MKAGYRIGIDIGGTFTDIVVMNVIDGSIKLVKKVRSTPTNPAKAVVSAIKEIRKELQRGVESVIHATTIGTNALLGQEKLRLPRTALITTKGFRDVLEIGRQRRPELYNLFVERPRPLIPRRYRFEVNERINYRGEILKPLSREELINLKRLIKEGNFESVAISLLHSYVNKVHEEIIEKELRKELTDLFISASYKVNPEHREYERTSTTVVNAILMPIVSRYLKTLSENVTKLLETKILIMQSNGGVESIENAIELPISIIESGPASGVMATNYLINIIGRDNAMSFDMGGTTAKAGTIINGKPLITTEYEVGGRIHVGRVIKGSGYPVRYPFIDLAEISAGGGSIVWVDEGGALKVGPISAGSDPGPACYGKGGENPTITDAHVILGRLNSNYLLGGELRIYLDKAVESFKAKVTNEIGLDPVEAAIGALKIANSLMSKIMRIVSVERGIDPKDLTLVAFGGAGPMHACNLGSELGMREIVIPTVPGVFSAIGLLVVDYKHTLIKSIRKTINQLDFEALNNIFAELEEKGINLLKSEGVSEDRISVFKYVDARYLGQGYELIINSNDIAEKDYPDKLIERFHKAHEGRYGYFLRDEEVEVVNARVEVIGAVSKPRLRKIKSSSHEVKPINYREAYFESSDSIEKAPVYERATLPINSEIHGPAIIEQYDSTLILEANWVLRVDEYGNLILGRD